MPHKAAEAVLSRGVRTAVLKLSGEGCAIYTREVQHLCPAFDIEARDTTGAGDCFVAGFLASMLKGASLADAGRFANAVAALSVQKMGAVEGVLSTVEVEAWMKSTSLRFSGKS
jgi:sugar/nucleoside kinase (ribokinase family)